MGAVTSRSSSAVVLHHVGSDAGASLLTSVPPGPCSPFFFLSFPFRETGEGEMKWSGKILVASIMKKLLKEGEMCCYEGWCK